MTLSCIYIPGKGLPFLFGEEHEGLTINLGGRYIYTIKENSTKKLTINKEENLDFIDNFWSKDIKLVSAIAGANGTGKTSILRYLIEELSSNPAARNCIFIYEDKDSVQIQNETDLKLDNSFGEDLTRSNTPEFLYYSPNLDYDLTSINSRISLVNYHKQDLVNYYLGNIKRHLLFLKNDKLISRLKQSYEDFPFYDRLTIRAQPLLKGDFEKIYIQTDLGNKVIRIRNKLLNSAKDHPNKSITLEYDEIETHFNENDTIQDTLKVLWKNKSYSRREKEQYVSGGIDFIKDVEINILSYLVLGDVFALDGDNGSYLFENILDANTFEEKLTHYLKKFITQTSRSAYESLDSEGVFKKFEESDEADFDELKKEVEKISFPSNSLSSEKIKSKCKSILTQINKIESVYKFYKALCLLQRKEYCNPVKAGFELDIKKGNVEDFNSFLDLYESMMKHLRRYPLEGVLEIKTNKRLSTGEKSILDFYASIYDYINKIKPGDDIKDYILFLDEPEQGYHPLWKKKFINALVNTLPILIDKRQNQIVFTTHDPLTLSDIPNSNIVYLYKKDPELTTILQQSSENRPTKTFGANISDLLADSFFIDDGLIGDFAKTKISKLIKWLNDNNNEDKEYFRNLINLIDEPLLKYKLEEMYNDKFPQDINKAKAEQEIRDIAKKHGLDVNFNSL